MAGKFIGIQIKVFRSIGRAGTRGVGEVESGWGSYETYATRNAFANRSKHSLLVVILVNSAISGKVGPYVYLGNGSSIWIIGNA